MAQRYFSPFEQYLDTTGLPLSGAQLFFYQTGTSTKLTTYSDSALTVPNTNPIVLNTAGRPSVGIFLQNQDYKVVLAPSTDTDPPTSPIWTADPVRSSDFADFSIDKVGSGNPNGVVAGTAGSSGVLPTRYWDYTNNILYVCTTTGNAAAAVWTAINTSSSTITVPQPPGYLTLTSATPVITGDVTAATSVFYTPATGNQIGIYNGSSFVVTTFSELTLTLVSSHAASTIYDVFVFSNSGTPTVATGPAWNSSSAGSSSRGSGAGTTQLTRLNGLLVNAQQITARNGSTTYTIAGNFGTYVGSIFIDGSAGQVSCHRSYGQNRKWGVWNAYNRVPIALQMGDSTASWSYTTNTNRQSNGAAGNTATVFCGLQEETIAVDFTQILQINTTATMGIGQDSTTTFSGKVGKVTMNNGGGSQFSELVARHQIAPLLGISNLNSLENGGGAGTASWQGTNANMLLTVRWRG